MSVSSAVYLVARDGGGKILFMAVEDGESVRNFSFQLPGGLLRGGDDPYGRLSRYVREFFPESVSRIYPSSLVRLSHEDMDIAAFLGSISGNVSSVSYPACWVSLEDALTGDPVQNIPVSPLVREIIQTIRKV